jgi:ORF6N domain
MATKEKQKASLTVIEGIEEKIYLIRGMRVMLDSDLAEVYQVETRVLKQAVRRNLHRFPLDFMFELSLEETRRIESLRSQTVTLDAEKSKRGKYSKYAPFAFTEHGAVMLASVLNSATAIEASIKVVRAFVRLRTLVSLHEEIRHKLEELERKYEHHDSEIVRAFEILDYILIQDEKPKRKIGYLEEKKSNKD